MFDFLLTSLPRELVIEIVLFEGRVMRAYLRDYVSQVYTRHYKAYFGYKHCLKYITGGYSYRDNMASLPYYAAWSTLIRAKHPHFVKARLPHKHMRPYKKLIPKPRLEKERLLLEREMARYLNPTTRTSFYALEFP